MKATTATNAIALLLASASALCQNTKVVSAWNYYRFNELDKAQQAIDEAIHHPSTSNKAKTWYYRGLIYLKIATSEAFKNLTTNPLDTAYLAFVRAWQLDERKDHREEIPQHIELITNIWYNEGVQSYSQGNYAPAYENFRRAVQATRWLKEQGLKNNIDTALEVASMQSAYLAGMMDAALNHWNYLEQNGILDKQAVLIAGNIYLRENQPEKVHQLADKAINALPEARADILKLKINAYLLEGKTQEVASLLDEALTADPHNIYLWIIKGEILLKQNNINAAEQAYVRATQVAPDNFDAQYSAGAFYYNRAVDLQNKINELPLDAQDQYEKLMKERDLMLQTALPYLENAHQLNPSDTNTLRALVEIYMRLGNKEKAQQLMQLLEGNN